MVTVMSSPKGVVPMLISAPAAMIAVNRNVKGYCQSWRCGAVLGIRDCRGGERNDEERW